MSGSVGQLIVAGAGAAVGGLFGSPQAGWLLGSALGAALFSPEAPDSRTEGPRLGDLTVSSSAYGAVVPRSFGRIRLSGNMIWSTGIQETKNVQSRKVGGKGGGGAKQTSVTYEYFASFALAFGEGPKADVLRMWADGKLIYDKTSDSDDIAKVGLSFRFYSGDESQQPDSIIVQDKGESNTPAYRGLCYIVFDRLPLKDFGNRVPSITAELTDAASDEYPTEDYDLITTAEGGIANEFDKDHGYVDDARSRLYARGKTPANDEVLRIIDLRAGREVRQKLIEEPDIAANPLVVTPEGDILLQSGISNSVKLALLDPDALEVQATFGQTGNSIFSSETQVPFTPTGQSAPVLTGYGESAVVLCAFFNSVSVLRTTGGVLEYVWDSDTFQPIADSRTHGACQGAVTDSAGECYVTTGSSLAGGPDFNLYKGTFRGFRQATSFEFEQIGSYSATDLEAGATEFTAVLPPLYDPTDDSVILQQTVAPSNNSYVFKVDSSDGSIIWKTAVPDVRNEKNGLSHSDVTAGLWALIGGAKTYVMRLSDGSIILEEEDSVWIPDDHLSTHFQYWDSRTGIVYDVSRKYKLFRGSGDGGQLDAVVEDLCLQSGLASSDVDVSDLNGIDLPGYVIGRQSTARASLEQLAQMFFFDAIESDDVLKFVLRQGSSADRTILEDQLAPLDDESGEFFRESRIQEVELPMRVTLTYMDPALDYQQQAHSARRLRAPVETVSSRSEVNTGLPLAVSSETAKQSAEKALISAWQERTSYSFRLPWTFLDLDPGDLVDVSLDNGSIFRTRLTQVEIGADLVMEMSALSQQPAQYNSDATADNGDGPLKQDFNTSAITRGFVLPTVLLRDGDDTARQFSTVYYALAGLGQPGWNAGTLFKSADNANFSQVGSSVAEATWGVLAKPLAPSVSPFATDEDNELQVILTTNQDIGLSGVSQLEMLNSANAALVFKRDGSNLEVVQFRDAVENSDGSYSLTGLLRGRRGTEGRDAHPSGELFMLIEPEALDRLLLSLDEVGQERFYSAVGEGQSFEQSRTFARIGDGDDLKPYAPVQLAASGSLGSDIDLSWERRARVNGALRDFTGEVALAEDSEEYDLEIVDAAGVVVRTVDGLTSKSYTYTSVDQSSDFPTTTGFVDLTGSFLSNSGFESATTSAGETVPGWTTREGGDALQVRTGTDGNIAGAQAGSNWLSMEETSMERVEVSQDLDLSAMAAGIRDRNVTLRLGVYVASSLGDTDTVTVHAEWRDAVGNVMSTDSTTPLDPADDGSWTQVTLEAKPPIGARTCRMRVVGNRESGSSVNVSVDSASVEVKEDIWRLRFRVYQVSAQVDRGFPSKVAEIEV